MIAFNLPLGTSRTLYTVAVDSAGAPVASAPALWSTSNAASVAVTQGGVVTAVGAVGTSATITATVGGRTDTAVITVAAAVAPVASVTIAPNAGTAEPGAVTALAPVLKDASLNVLAGRTITYTASNEAVAVVLSDGRVLALAIGSAVITATSEGVSATYALTVAIAPVVVPEFEYVPARDGFWARGTMGMRVVHLANRNSVAQAGSGAAGVVFQDRGDYADGTDAWNEFGGTGEPSEPQLFVGSTGWEGATIVSGVDPVVGGTATSDYGPGHFMGTKCRRFNLAAWDGLASGPRPHIFSTYQTTALEAAGQAAGDDLLHYRIVAYRTDIPADVGKKLVVRLTGITSGVGAGMADELRKIDKATILNRTADCWEQEITLSGQWQVVVATLRVTAAEWAAARTDGTLRLEIMQTPTVASMASSVCLADGWNMEFYGIPDNKTEPQFAFRPPRYRTYLGSDPGSGGLAIPRHETRLFSRAQNPAIVQTLYSDALANAAWVKGGGVAVAASARAVPDARQYPAERLDSVVWPTTGTLAQDANHTLQDPVTGVPAALGMGWRAVYVRAYVRDAAGGATPDLTGFTATITTLVAGVPTTVYGPTPLGAVDEFGITTTRFGFPQAEAASRYRVTITNTGAARTLLMRRVVVESGAGNNGGGEMIVPTQIPCRTTSGWRGQSGTHWQLRDAGDLISPRKGAWLTRVYLTQNFADPTFNINAAGNAALLVDHGPIANSMRKINLDFEWDARAGYSQRLHSLQEGDTARGRTLNALIDVSIYADGVQGSALKYGSLAQAGSRGLKDFALVWDNWLLRRARIGAVTYESGLTEAQMNYTAAREWSYEGIGPYNSSVLDSDSDGMFPWGDRDRRLALCANVIGFATWYRYTPSAVNLEQCFKNWPTGAAA